MTAMTVEDMYAMKPAGSVIPFFNFTGYNSGDSVQAADGAYDFDNKVYVVEEGRIQHIWHNEENQMAFEFEGI
ncbi:hypothetical protein TCA2_4404 [Paenibacillus sp. TCA20]|uniref:hypothetical protein n=1 Tax=Paenibacillus sp. TCA20 TaxID=1499968 RepID=UPI0004D92781|nr:hypothetical protein [Paenibacillus sp. TCA20]GAK41912.1 hypothetical protein TCA2_4404 [Paenibacillus sp. TCA20]